MALDFVKPGEAIGGLNVFLYGPPKVGKSSGAASAKGPVLYGNGERPNALRFAHSLYGDQLREVRIDSLETLHEFQAVAESGEFPSVVLDPLTGIHKTLLEEASKRRLNPKLDEYRAVGIHVDRVCRALCDAPCHAVFVTHEVEVEGGDEGRLEKVPAMGTNNPRPANNLMGHVDVIGYCGRRETEEGKPPVYVAQLYDGHGRRGGDRTNLLDDVEVLDLAAWVDKARPWLEGRAANEKAA